MTRRPAAASPQPLDEERGAVELIDVARYFGSTAAVDGISLRVHPGEFLSLLGPSGCGKTTTLRLLAGFEQPDRGQIMISGQPVAGVPPHKRDINTVFQAYALFPHMTVAENVAYGLRQRSTPRAQVGVRVSDALDMVRMTAMADRKPQQLSGGQQQRVALARALVNRPSVLLLDEPLGALDRKLREEMQVELKLLQSELKTTFVFVTHDQEEALAMSDRVAVMLDGRIEQIADPFAIYEHPETAFVAGFLGRQNFFYGTVADKGRTIRGDGVVLRAAASTDGIPDGSSVMGAVRPEAITMRAGESTSAVNSVAGALVSVAHLGDTVQHIIRVGENQTVLVRTRRTDSVPRERGTSVVCQWPESSVRIFDAAQAKMAELAATLTEDQDTASASA
ncbi:ABC transporter ATP-binding protein [Leekyejoonella antrihumi]|uniref:Spermidine/putrescine import ATP-binding protein PotA n=1 Tax=Leekyejoonella antrihumi TaxID=1660198 RepID=A0A563E251_9MICO|nr:ABC transporter ATP-binding protein [Leekyejoonella antrihumi]TWP36628.1 ABC transporter ATP-binding protein [Leekyejoonella antrihumi]